MFVKHGPPTKEELPIRCSLFANKQEGWQSGTILEECDECGNPDDSEDEAEGVNGGHFKIKFDDGDQGVLEFPDATCLLHGNNVCIQAMSKGVKLHSRVAVESDNDSYQVGQLLGANLDGSRVSVHLDANEQWMDASQVFALIAPAEGDTFDNPPGAVVLPSKKREREKTATNDTKSKKKSATDNKSVAPPPKKAKSSYIIFSCEMRSTVKDEMPEASMAEISKVLGARWQNLAASEKKIYEDKAAEDKIRAKNAKKAYVAEHGEPSTIAAGSKNTKAAKDPNAPKKAKSSFIIFSTEMRPTVKDEMPEASMGEISKVLGARWQDLAASEKKIYEDKQGRRGQDSSRERKEGLRR